MKARPILFSGPMVRALLDGRKTQTRRVVKLNAAGRVKLPGSTKNWHLDDPEAAQACPYGKTGDLLWIRETCRAEELEGARDGVRYQADGHWEAIDDTAEAAARWVDMNHYRADAAGVGRGATVPPIHMPRWASRLTLRLTDVRMQRLQEISEDDAIADGISAAMPSYGPAEGIYQCWMPDGKRHFEDSAYRLFQKLREQINGAGSWSANPYVWALIFEVIRKNVDEVLSAP